jgi:hypothetical protein
MGIETYKGTATDDMARVGSTPDVGALVDELRRSSTDYGVQARATRVEDTRYCRWAGQTDDGKKWNDAGRNKPAFPWDGASDTRIPLADEVINGLVDLCSTAFWRSMLRVSPTNVSQLDQAVTAHSLMDWAMNARMYNDLTRDVELLAQYLWTYGWTGAHITWQQEIGQKEQYLTMEQIVAMASTQEAGTALADFPALVMNPEADDQSAELLRAAFPNLSKRRALKAIRELRSEGECDFPVPTMVTNKPMVSALAPWDELVIPPETTDIQSARVIFRRCYMTEAQVLNKVETDDWDEAWAAEAISTMGRFSDLATMTTVSVGIAENSILDRENLIEVVYAYQKSLDEDGVPGVFYTVFCPQVGDKWGYFEALDYTHGQYPFVIWRSEMIHRQIVESRGVPEITMTWQEEVKAQRDSVFDYTSLATLPPIEVPKTRGGNLKIGPAVQVPVLRRGEIGFMQPPAREPGVAFQLIAAVKEQTDRYFGRPTDLVPPAVTQMRQQRYINNWLHGWTEAFRQVLSLTLQYMGPEEIVRITGSTTPVKELTDFDVMLKFDVRELSTDLVTEKLKAISALVLPLDTAGVVDRAKLVSVALRAIDPNLASELVMQQGPAAQKMFSETNDEIALISLGNPPTLRENDPTAAIRLQFSQQVLQANPKYQMQLQQDPLFQANLQKYIENLQFSVQQQQNAVTGRLGVQS